MKAISSPEGLLKVLEEEGLGVDYGTFTAEYVFMAGRSPKLRCAFLADKWEMKVQPLLQPSRKWLQREDEKNTLLFAPHIPDELSHDLRAAGISHGDLNGRLFVLVEKHVIDIRPRGTRYKTVQKGIDPFSLKATRILRAFLAHRPNGLTPFTQDWLTERTQVSRSLVSQVLGKLTEEGYVGQIGEGGRGGPAHYTLKDFDQLLDDWAQRDIWEKRVEIRQFSVLANELEIITAGLLDAVGRENLAFTQWIAAWKRRPHTTPPLVSAYLRQPKLLDAVPGRPVRSGGNLWLILPKDEGVWFETQESGGLPLVCDVQIYLDLLQVSQRGPEQAEELRKWEGFAR